MPGVHASRPGAEGGLRHADDDAPIGAFFRHGLGSRVAACRDGEGDGESPGYGIGAVHGRCLAPPPTSSHSGRLGGRNGGRRRRRDSNRGGERRRSIPQPWGYRSLDHRILVAEGCVRAAGSAGPARDGISGRGANRRHCAAGPSDRRQRKDVRVGSREKRRRVQALALPRRHSRLRRSDARPIADSPVNVALRRSRVSIEARNVPLVRLADHERRELSDTRGERLSPARDRLALRGRCAMTQMWPLRVSHHCRTISWKLSV